jgi:hypothetical protein
LKIMKKSTNGFSSVFAQQKHKIFKKTNWNHCLYGKINSGNRQPEGILDIKLQLQQIIILSFNFKCSGHCLKDLKCLYNLYNQKNPNSFVKIKHGVTNLVMILQMLKLDMLRQQKNLSNLMTF